MSDKPRRAYILKIEFGANTLDDLCWALRQTAIDLRVGDISTRGCSGSPSCGFTYEYDVDESWTKERYFAALDDWLASVDRSPKGQDPEEGLGRNDESAAPKADAQ